MGRLNIGMEEEIVRLLKFRGDPISDAAAIRIEDLEAEVEQLQVELALTRSQVMRTNKALACCGITSFFPALEDPADAILQMANYVLGARGTDGVGKRLGEEVE